MTTLPLTGRWGLREPITDEPESRSLAGRRFALSTDRKLDLFAGMLHKRSGTVVRVPMWSYWPAANDPDAQAWVQGIIDGRVSDIVWLSPDGAACATRVAAGLDQDWALVKALRRCRHFARGRMTAVALQRMGVICTDFTREPDDQALRRSLARHRVIRRRVALQIHRRTHDRETERYLRSMRCEVRSASLYQLPAGRENQQVAALVRAIIADRIDALLVSDLPEVGRLFTVAAQTHARPQLREALRRTTLATFSPRLAHQLEQIKLPARLAPHRAFALRQLVEQFEQQLGPRG